MHGVKHHGAHSRYGVGVVGGACARACRGHGGGRRSEEGQALAHAAAVAQPPRAVDAGVAVVGCRPAGEAALAAALAGAAGVVQAPALAARLAQGRVAAAAEAALHLAAHTAPGLHAGSICGRSVQVGWVRRSARGSGLAAGRRAEHPHWLSCPRHGYPQQHKGGSHAPPSARAQWVQVTAPLLRSCSQARQSARPEAWHEMHRPRGLSK